MIVELPIIAELPILRRISAGQPPPPPKLPVDADTQRRIDESCEQDLRDSLAMAARFNAMKREGRIGHRVTYADFIAVAQVARAWGCFGEADCAAFPSAPECFESPDGGEL